MSTVTPKRTVRTGFAPALPLHLLLSFTRGLRRRVPRVAVHVTQLFSVEQLRRLRSGELDLGIVVDPGEPPDLESELLFPGELLYACLPAGHRLADRQLLRPPDVRDETLLCGGRSINPAVYERTMEAFETAGYRFRTIDEQVGPTARDAVFAVASARGIALLPASLEELNDAAADVAVRPLDPPLRLPSTAVTWRRDAEAALLPVLEAVRSVARELYEAASADARGAPPPGALTPRQLEVLRLLADGKSTGEIAAELGLSETTVRNHIAGLMSALGAHTRLQAVLAAKRAGLLEL